MSDKTCGKNTFSQLKSQIKNKNNYLASIITKISPSNALSVRFKALKPKIRNCLKELIHREEHAIKNP